MKAKKNLATLFAGIVVGMAFAPTVTYAAAQALTAEPSSNPIYVDGRLVQMTAYRIGGNNYVKLRDVGKAVGFNVYWQDGVQIDSAAPYTGEAPAKTEALSLTSYKGDALAVGDRSALVVSPDTGYTVTSNNPSVAALEKVSGKWVITAKGAGSATITAADAAGRSGSLTVTVRGSAKVAAPSAIPPSGSGLAANMELRQEMIRLINQVRRESGVAELTVNQALMDAAQDTTTHKPTQHTDYEVEVVRAYGYPYGTSTNLTWFNRAGASNIAERAVTNWVNSSMHFQTMTAARYDSLGVGVTVENDIAYCIMYVGNPNGINP